MAYKSWIAAWFAKIMKRHTPQPDPTATPTEDPQEEQQPDDALTSNDEDEDDSYQSDVEDSSAEDESELIDEATPAENMGADTAAHTAPSAVDGSDKSTGNLWNTARRAAVTKVTVLLTQVKDFTANAIEQAKKLGVVGTAKAIGNWIRLHPSETAFIVALIALACTAIGLSVVGFGAGGIAAGMRYQ